MKKYFKTITYVFLLLFVLGLYSLNASAEEYESNDYEVETEESQQEDYEIETDEYIYDINDMEENELETSILQNSNVVVLSQSDFETAKNGTKINGLSYKDNPYNEYYLASGSYILSEDIDIGVAILHLKDKTVIDLNNKTLKNDDLINSGKSMSGQSLLNFWGDITIKGGGKIVSSNEQAIWGQAGLLLIDNVIIDGNVVSIYDVTVNSGTINGELWVQASYNEVKQKYGEIVINDGIFNGTITGNIITINNGVFNGNDEENNDICVLAGREGSYSAEKSLIINDGVFNGVVHSACNENIINGGEFCGGNYDLKISINSYHKSKQIGSVGVVATAGTVTVNGGLFKGNIGLYSVSGKLISINGGDFVGLDYGLYISSDADSYGHPPVQISEGNFKGEKGGIFCEGVYTSNAFENLLSEGSCYYPNCELISKNTTQQEISVVKVEDMPVTPSSGTVTTSGIYCASTSPSIVAGLVTEKSNPSDDVEYRWLVCEESEGTWTEVSPWTKNNEWLNWTPYKTGNYVFVCQARVVGNDDSLISESFGTPYKKEGGIKQICQMPYWGEGGGYLIGFESYDNPNQEYQYEMFVMDLSLLAAGSPTPWVHATGKISIPAGATPEDGRTMWTIWQPEYGYYLTLFRLYDKDGNMIDEVPYGFANAY